MVRFRVGGSGGSWDDGRGRLLDAGRGSGAGRFREGGGSGGSGGGVAVAGLCMVVGDRGKYLIGTLHRYLDFELALFKTMDLVEETFDETEGLASVTYRRRATEIGKLLPMTEDEEHPYHIQGIVQYTAEYAPDHLEATSKAVKLTSLLCAL